MEAACYLLDLYRMSIILMRVMSQLQTDVILLYRIQNEF